MSAIRVGDVVKDKHVWTPADEGKRPNYTGMLGTILRTDPVHREALVEFQVPPDHPEAFLYPSGKTSTWFPWSSLYLIRGERP